MRARTVLASGALGFVALTSLAVMRGNASIEDDLTERAAIVLRDNGVDGSVEVEGRDVTVVLHQPLSESDTAVLGQRVVDALDARSVELTNDSVEGGGGPTSTTVPATVSPAEPTPPMDTSVVPATVPITPVTSTSPPVAAPGINVLAQLQTDGTITLEGTVFSVVEQLALTVTAARVVGESNVIDRLVVIEGDPAVGDPRVAGLVRVVELFGSKLSPASAQVVDDLVTVSGRLTDGTAADELSRVGTIAVSQGVRFDTSQVTEG